MSNKCSFLVIMFSKMFSRVKEGHRLLRMLGGRNCFLFRVLRISWERASSGKYTARTTSSLILRGSSLGRAASHTVPESSSLGDVIDFIHFASVRRQVGAVGERGLYLLLNYFVSSVIPLILPQAFPCVAG